MEELYKYLSPFIAAFLASYGTYLFTIRGKKYDILLRERITAFKTVQQRIVSLKRYCLAMIAEYEGNEFAPHFEGLSDEDKMSALEHRAKLSHIVEDNLIFLSHSSRKSLNELDGQLSLLCNLELLLAGNPDETIKSSAKSAYDATFSIIESCIDELYSELKLPK